MRRWIRRICRLAGVTPSKLAAEAGLAATTVNRFLAGRAQRNLTASTIEKLFEASARLIRANFGHRLSAELAGENAGQEQKRGYIANFLIRTSLVVGHVAANEWQDSFEWPEGDQYPVDIPVQAPYHDFDIVCLEVKGPSINLHYPEGTLVCAVSFEQLGRPPSHGERVVVHRDDGEGRVEATVKEYRIDSAGNVWLWPQSDHPDHQQPLRFEHPGNLKVALLVIGSYRPEPQITPRK